MFRSAKAKRSEVAWCEAKVMHGGVEYGNAKVK